MESVHVLASVDESSTSKNMFLVTMLCVALAIARALLLVMAPPLGSVISSSSSLALMVVVDSSPSPS